MKKIRKIFIGVLFLMVVFQVLGIKNVEATDETFFSENGKGGITITSNDESNIYGMQYNYVIGETVSDDNLNTQEINVFSMKTDGVYSKLVNWAYQSSNHTYKRVTLDEVAKDYEERHPGWIVLGGINGDQYAMESNYSQSNVPFYPQPFYPLIMEGERRFTVGLFGSQGNYVGLENNGENNPFIYESQRKGYYIYVYNENNEIIKEYKIDHINSKPSIGETTVWMSYEKLNKTTDESFYCPSIEGEHIYLISDPELAYVSNAPEYERAGKTAEYVGFGRGKIDQIVTSCKVDVGQFAIETSNEEIIKTLSIGTKVVVQDSYVDEALNKVESSAGFHSAHRLNDKDVETTAAYDTKQYSRSIFGRKADGTYVLLTASMATKVYRGLNHDEANAYLKSIGVVEAYQQDGGGSVCAIVRNEFGGFDIVNKPKDGTTRANFNGLLFVVRDPGFSTSIVNNTRNSIIINKIENENSKLISNVIVEVDGKKYNFDAESIEIPNLKEDTTYQIKYTFNITDPDTKVSKEVSYTATSTTKAFVMPSSGLKVTNINKNQVTIEKGKTDKSAWFQDIIIKIDEEEYIMGNQDSIVIDNLFDDTSYEATITYKCVEASTGNIYYGTEIKKFKTLSYEIPTIPTFSVSEKNNRVLIECKYTDPDNVVDYAYIYINDEVYKTFNSKTYNETIRKLDLENNEYKFQLKLSYSVGSIAREVFSEIITIGQKSNKTIWEIEYNLDGGINNEDNPITYVEGEITNVLEPSKEGYDFIGWSLNGEIITEISSDVIGNIVLVAKWQKKKQIFTIKYNLDGGINNEDNPTSYEEGNSVILLDPSREGYTFLGWYCDEERIINISDQNITVTAKWQKIETKKGCSCKKNSLSVIISLITLVCCISIIRKKH